MEETRNKVATATDTDGVSDVLFTIQQELNAPKGQYNSFGKYKYRSCEDILAAVKPLLNKTKSTLNLSDDIVAINSRIYVKATATLTSSDGKIYSTSAYAREDEVKKGMDGSQITGAASSYARKYALNGLFAIDDTKDADATNTHGKETPASSTKNGVSEGIMKQAIAEINASTTREQINDCWNKWRDVTPEMCQQNTAFYAAAAKRLNEIGNQGYVK